MRALRRGVFMVALVGAVGCSTGPAGDPAAAGGGGGADGGSAVDAAPGGDLASAITDEDHDGLDDAQELAWARAYLPYISHSPTEECKLGGLLVRVRPHPQDPKLLHIVYDFLYDDDCGTALGNLDSHPGDDEVFATTVDPRRPGPDGILAMKAISHQGTPCERTSECGRCPGQKACATLPRNGVAWPAVWPSKNKHGSYVNRAESCTSFSTCFDQCEDNASPTVPELVNAGEPQGPLTRDLTDHGFITAADGWTHMELFHYDPWSGNKFGGAGDVAGDLVDAAFDTPACAP